MWVLPDRAPALLTAWQQHDDGWHGVLSRSPVDMADDAVSKLLDESRRDPALAQALAGAKTVEDAVRVAAEHGITVTAAELQQLSEPLSDEDLDAVSGGSLQQIWPTTPWVAC